MDTNAALDEFTARHQAAHPAAADCDRFDILFANAYRHETELTHRWTEIARTGMVQDPQLDSAAILNTVTDATQHALDDYTATIRDAPRPSRVPPAQS